MHQSIASEKTPRGQPPRYVSNMVQILTPEREKFAKLRLRGKKLLIPLPGENFQLFSVIEIFT